jgi:eukaryotic-like serine/threonine-protein kinase
MIKPGARLGPYEIDSSIGAGGMGEVYSARDTRLDRSVALKVLPTEFAGNAQFKLRFEREAKTISSLNHPNICQLFDIGEAVIEARPASGVEHADVTSTDSARLTSRASHPIHYLVMELLRGETLAARLQRGALPLEQALRVAIEIAGALENAHRHGIIHRDLKPANVMLTPTGAKLLDFGLAKSSPIVSPTGDTSMSGATHHRGLTEEGTILGTFQYMAPEQLEGTEADARTDIFAFGAMLYEMVTGRRAFEGKTRTSLIAAIVDRDPPPIAAVQPLTPPALERIIRVCLAKDPDERWQTAHDLLLQLRWIEEAGSEAGIAAPIAARRRTRERFAWSLHLATAVLAVAITAGVIAWRREAPKVVQTSIVAPAGAQFHFVQGPMALAPDGSRVAFLAEQGGGRMLWVRPLNGSSAQPLAGTAGASHPFWSPDSRYIGFFAGGKLRKIDANGGPAQTIADAPDGRGGSWSSGGMIVFAPNVYSGLQVVSDVGGVSTPVTKLEKNIRSHRLPWFLPDGRHFIYLMVAPGGPQQSHVIRLASADGSVSRDLTEANSGAIFANGHLLYLRDESLVAQSFDPKSFVLGRDLTPIAEGVSGHGHFHGTFSANDRGMLIYETGSDAGRSQLTFLDAQGKQVQTVGKDADYRNPVLSNDGTRIAVSIETAGGSDIWVIDISRGTSTRLTFEPGNEFVPLWSPDDEYIIYTSNAKSPGDIMIKRSSGTGSAEVLYESPHLSLASDWSADGRTIAMQEVNAEARAGWDLWLITMPEKKAELFLQTPFQETQAKISPDSRWLSYSSNESGRNEVYVQALSGGGGKWQISTEGGERGRWSRDGQQLFYEAGDRLMAVDVSTAGGRFQASVPRELFSSKSFRKLPGWQFDVTGDGKRFLANVLTEEARVEPLTLVQNWPQRLKRNGR